MNIPADNLDEGSATVGATTDVLTAYRLINEAGGMVIAAHANSSNGVAMRGFPLGGQTKISYTPTTKNRRQSKMFGINSKKTLFSVELEGNNVITYFDPDNLRGLSSGHKSQIRAFIDEIKKR